MLNTFKLTAFFSPLAIGCLVSLPSLAFSIDFTGNNDTVDKIILLQSDVSGSVSGELDGSDIATSEFGFVRDGYVNALKSERIQSAIADSPNGIVFGFQYWATTPDNMITDSNNNKWFLLKTQQDATDFANLIQNESRPFKGGTNIGAAIARGEAELGALVSPNGTSNGDFSYTTNQINTPIGPQSASATNGQGIIENYGEIIIDIAGDGIHDRQTLDGDKGPNNIVFLNDM